MLFRLLYDLSVIVLVVQYLLVCLYNAVSKKANTEYHFGNIRRHLW